MKNCTICGNPLSKKGIEKGRTEHYACRCAKMFKKNGAKTSNTRQKTAFKAFMKFPESFYNLFT